MGSSCATQFRLRLWFTPRGTPCTFSIILRKSREHLEQQPPQIVVARIRALPLVRIPSAWNLFLTLLRYRQNLVPRGFLVGPDLLALMVQQTFMHMLTPL